MTWQSLVECNSELTSHIMAPDATSRPCRHREWLHVAYNYHTDQSLTEDPLVWGHFNAWPRWPAVNLYLLTSEITFLSVLSESTTVSRAKTCIPYAKKPGSNSRKAQTLQMTKCTTELKSASKPKCAIVPEWRRVYSDGHFAECALLFSQAQFTFVWKWVWINSVWVRGRLATKGCSMVNLC